VRACVSVPGDICANPADCAGDEWGAHDIGHKVDPEPMYEGGHASGEVLGNLILAIGKQRDRERAGREQELVHRRLASHRKTHKRWLEREGDQRTDGETDLLPAGLDRDHSDAVGEPVHDTAEIGVAHRAMLDTRGRVESRQRTRREVRS
jgi:hypothetical protein